MEAIRSSEISVYTRSTGATSQKMEFFIVISVKTSNLNFEFYPEDGGDTFIRNLGSYKIYRRHTPEDGNLLPRMTCRFIRARKII
jgi:hypothetical protein